MRRRALLAGLSGVLGGLGLAGCNGGNDPAAGDRVSPTPAPVPTRRRTPGPASRSGGCPELPLDAEIVRCSSEATGESIRLRPESSVYDAGSGPFTVSLHNGTALTFRTGRDQWLLAGRTGEEWTVVARGAGEDLLWVGPGESFSWVLGGDEGTEGSQPLEVALGGGPHALAVVGAVPRGVRTALVARFRIEPSLG